MLNRFFGQKPQEDPKKDQAQEQDKPTPEQQRMNFLGRTRQLFTRLGNTVQETDTITDDLWDELEESLLAADVGPGTTDWLIERLRQRVEEEHMRTGSQAQQALREELASLLGPSSSLRFAKQSPLTVILVIGEAQ